MAKNCAGHVALGGVARIASTRSVPPICSRSHLATWHSPFSRHENNDGVLNKKGNMRYPDCASLRGGRINIIARSACAVT
jgi:hypothetical protein